MFGPLWDYCTADYILLNSMCYFCRIPNHYLKKLCKGKEYVTDQSVIINNTTHMHLQYLTKFRTFILHFVTILQFYTKTKSLMCNWLNKYFLNVSKIVNHITVNLRVWFIPYILLSFNSQKHILRKL